MLDGFVLRASWDGFCLQFVIFANLAVHHGGMGVWLLLDRGELVLPHAMGQVVLGW